MWVNLGLDLTVVASLLVLGGDFWDKLQALFLYDARVVWATAQAPAGTTWRGKADQPTP